MNNDSGLNFIKEYTSLDNRLFSYIEPKRHNNVEIVLMNEDLAKSLNIDKTFLRSKKGISFLSGQTNEYGPLYAQAYAGHQYGYFTLLGDGRAMFLGEQVTKDGIYDIQLKGSGITPYSRRGDGKGTLYSMLREYLISEAMNGLKIETTRTLAVLDTNEMIQRRGVKKAGIMTRVASSHVRVGTFEFVRTLDDFNALKELADFTINRHYKELEEKDDKYRLLLRSVIDKQASLIAKWQSVGFIHGVMNTDNMTVSGETIDYGPCAFMNVYDPNTVFSSIDSNGRYAYQNQPYIGSWNLSKFAESILPLLSKDTVEAVTVANTELEKYGQLFKKYYYDTMGKKLGIIDPTDEEKILVDEILLIIQKYKADYTNSFRLLTLEKYKELPFFDTDDFTIWFQKWTRKLGYRKMSVKDRRTLMEKHNPYIIPRNLLVEEALESASEKGDYDKFKLLLKYLKDPYNYKTSIDSKYLNDIESKEQYVTYCGT